MTGDELERAIDFLLKSQARAEARVEQQGTDFQKRLDSIANAHASLEDAHANLVLVLKQHLETQDLIDKSLRETDVRQARFSAFLSETLRASDESRRASDESLRTAMTELAQQTAETDRRLEALITIVKEERNRGQ